ncbi:xanthine dehydrogenase molybdopterin binding subunit [Sulfitobacter sp. F26204]|uniref:xanthine dehydrogenase molybdopterin binding subunit n=1 Tax=Sulfitobacter sp. F26204 TaxID=2996014 RepID=UPI00225E161B|nr:xanthine dehydrogenase molybdopterin binding subunit [Sulfitobacter sp. F26204]MCX7560971.1 xanthine dehydrogenase molybdopterin binding subunit [Sulfitobacter sp. F26204]
MSIAKPLPHDAARLHVTGQARYTDDIPTPADALHLAFGTSKIAAGTLTALHLEAVTNAPGVVAVLTAQDLTHDCDVSPSNQDEPLLAAGSVHHVGQPLFLVIATSHLDARRAAALGRADIAATKPILSVQDALDANSRFEDGPRIYQKGDAKGALASASQILTGRLMMGGQEHFYLEGQAALALPQEGGDMLVHSSTQHPTEIQHKVAHAIGKPMHAVRVETRRMGGGFGGKESQGNALAVACAVAAQKTQKPCKMRYDRDDDMIITGKRHDFQIDYSVGIEPDGRITAMDVTHYTRCGWAQDLSLPVADRAMLHADNAYHLNNVRIVSHRLKTNTQSATAFRGFGGPQGVLGIEKIMDHIAQHLELDPLAVRRINYYADRVVPSEPVAVPPPQPIHNKAADMTSRGSEKPRPSSVPAASETAQTTPYHQPVTDCIINALTDELAISADYSNRRAAIAEWNAKNTVLKRGIAFTPVKFGISFTLTHLNQAGALVHVYQDGSIHLNHGGTEMGQGLFQKVAQVAASRFGVPIEMIKITATDTAKVPNTSATAASSGSDLNGMAVQNACDEIRLRIEAHLAERYQTRDITFADGMVKIGSETITFADAAALAYQSRVSLSATGFYKTPDIEWDRIAGKGRPFFYFAYGAACTEVVIDTLTGENRILRTDILHDAGASLNPALDIGQIEGGYVQGAGWLTTEELVWDDKGALKTHAPSTYKIPACSDRPDIFNVALWDQPNPAQTVYRSKAVGEPPLMLGISAFLALSDAISATGPGYGDLQAPATAEAVLAAIGRAQK